MPRFVSVGNARKLKFGRNWGFAAFFMIFAFLFMPATELGTSLYDRQASATVTSVEKTRSSENDNTIYRIRYTFHDERGVVHAGTSYATTELAGDQPVMYLARDPGDSRLVDARTHPFGTFGFVIAVAVFGAAILIGWRTYANGTRWLHLLRHGTEVPANEIDRAHTPGDSETADSWRITFAFDRGGHTSTHEVTTHDAAFPSQVRVLYEGAFVSTIEEIPVDLTKEPGYSAHLLVLPCVTIGLAIATVVASMVH